MSVTLRMIGPRVLLRPLPPPPRSAVITLTDKAWTFAAEVVGIGHPRCPECGGAQRMDLDIGDRVYLPASKGHEITMNGETYWVVAYDDISGAFEATDETEDRADA